MFVLPGFEGLKIISAGKDGGRERVQFLEVTGQKYWRMKWSGTFLILPQKSVGNWQNAGGNY